MPPALESNVQDPHKQRQGNPLRTTGRTRRLEFLILLEKHSETYDSAVDKKATDDGHDHGGRGNEGAVSERSRQS